MRDGVRLNAGLLACGDATRAAPELGRELAARAAAALAKGIGEGERYPLERIAGRRAYGG
jgi:hypothetical protein